MGRTGVVNVTANDYTFDAGLVRTGSIGNYVWVDENSDGYQDTGERGLPNIRMFLKNCNTGATLATTYTDAQGGYLFDNLAPGTYCVDVDETTLPAGMVQAPFNLPGADFGNQNQSIGNGYQVVLPSGGENLTADFGYNWAPTTNVTGNTGTGTIGDRIWNALYEPLGRIVQRLADSVAWLQQGRISTYLLYSFITLVVLLAVGL